VTWAEVGSEGALVVSKDMQEKTVPFLPQLHQAG
jgi:hypothetical protein